MAKDDKSPKKERSPKKKDKKLESKFTEEEREWVFALEAAIRNEKDLNVKKMKLSEWDLALHAVVAKDQPAKAIQRLRRLQKFKEAYQVRDDSTVYEAIRIVHDFVHAHPDFLQAFGQDELGRWVIVFQLNGLLTTGPETSSIERKFAALYYICHALQPDLDAVRFGTVWIGDFEGITRQSLSMNIVNGGRALCRDSYPIKVKDVPCLNAPPRWSAVYAMCRPFFSRGLRDKMVYGCSPQLIQKNFPKHLLAKALGGTQSQHDILDLLEENIRKRFEMQETFRLNLL